MQEPVVGRDDHGEIDEDLVPLREGCVGCGRQVLVLVAFGDQFEGHGRLGLVPTSVTQVIQHEQVAVVQPVESGGSRTSLRAACRFCTRSQQGVEIARRPAASTV